MGGSNPQLMNLLFPNMGQPIPSFGGPGAAPPPQQGAQSLFSTPPPGATGLKTPGQMHGAPGGVLGHLQPMATPTPSMKPPQQPRGLRM